MTQKLLELEKITASLEPSPHQKQQWDGLLSNYAANFLDTIEEVPAFVEFDDETLDLSFKISDTPRTLSSLLDEMDKKVTKPGLNPASGGHLAYIPGGGVYPTAMGDYLAAVINKYAGIYFGGPGAVALENELIRWMCKMVGFPKTALGNLTSGGSIANLIAVTTARDAQNIKASNITKSVIYLTEQVHHSIQKAIRIAGLGECPLRYIPMDERYKMDVLALKNQIENDKKDGLTPFLLVASGGTTDTGAIDPLNDLADVSEANNMWFHIDAAYGGFFMLVDDKKAEFKGTERADSVTIDPHKGLFLAYGCGAVLVKNVEQLQNTHFYLANYMQDTQSHVKERSPADLSPELTKHFRGLRLWLPLQLFGVNQFKAALEEKLLLCQYFYQEIQEIGFEVGPEPELSVMIYRYKPQDGENINDFNKKLVDWVRQDGRVFLSSTSINGIFWIRLAVLCFRTHLRTIDLCLKVLKEGVKEIENREH